jgi:glutaredoxin
LTTVTLYSRPGCHLCDEARDGLLALGREGLDMQLHEVDIETDDRLHAMYLERIPVIALGGEIVSELEPDLAVLRARLDTLRA